MLLQNDPARKQGTGRAVEARYLSSLPPMRREVQDAHLRQRKRLEHQSVHSQLSLPWRTDSGTMASIRSTSRPTSASALLPALEKGSSTESLDGHSRPEGYCAFPKRAPSIFNAAPRATLSGAPPREIRTALAGVSVAANAYDGAISNPCSCATCTSQYWSQLWGRGSHRCRPKACPVDSAGSIEPANTWRAASSCCIVLRTSWTTPVCINASPSPSSTRTASRPCTRSCLKLAP